MNSDDATEDEAQFDLLLAAADEALAKGNGDLPSFLDTAPSELRPRLHRELAWCQQVRQLWSRATHSTGLHHPSTVRSAAHASADLSAANIGRFRILRELGRGGFGVVFLAYDPRLNRELALKIPREATLFSSELRERFQQEARVAANLDHPHIVQVYEAGEEDGICYIASAYCPGTDLAAWLRKHPAPVPADSAASLIATLAEAIAHAHARGVFHRDLKPGNILLQKDEGRRMKDEKSDAFGSDSSLTLHPSSFLPKITDFGLAKLVEDQAASMATVSPTGSGAIMGTPAYMAPEQAAGSNKTVGPAADIFSLGAILYELLTGRPPFQGDTPLETLLLVRTAEPVPPRRLRPKLPRDLETICLKCLAKEAPKRYASAQGLADDLWHFLANEPIQARPASPFERAQKWARRRPALAVLACVSAIAIVAIFLIVSISNVRLQKQRDIAEGHREEAESQRRRAILHLKEARAAVDQLLTRVGFERLNGVPYMEAVRRDLLRDALQFYQGFSEQESDDPELRFETGRAWRRLGKIHDELGDRNAADQSFRTALTIQTQLHSESADRVEFRQELAASLNNLGDLLLRTSPAADETRQSILRALDLQEKLVAEFPESASYGQELAESCDALGRQLYSNGQTKEAEDAFRRAVTVLEAVVATSPRDKIYELSLANRRRNLAVFLARQDRLKEAEPLFRNDLRFWEGREAESPSNPRFIGRAADASKHLGTLLINIGDPNEGESLIRRAIERWQRLADEYPKVLENHELLVGAKEKIARGHLSRKEYAQARPLLEQAIAHSQTCNKIRTPNTDQRVLLGSLIWLLADAQLQLGAYQAAAADAEKLHAVCSDRWQECYQAARLFTRCIPCAEQDKQLSENARQSDADHFGSRSVELLREAFRLGYKDLAFVKKDPGLDVLRSRDDFKRLLEAQAAK